MHLTNIRTLIKTIRVILLVSCFSACNLKSNTSTSTPNPTKLLPSPEVYTTRVPNDVQAVARAYLDAWKKEDYPSMFRMLTSSSRSSLSEDKFIQRYSDVANEAALNKIDYQILPNVVGPETAEIPFRVTLTSAIVGDIQRDTMMNLELENGRWMVRWDDTLILPELSGGNYLRMDRDTPTRASIYDRNGNPLAAQADAVAIGLWPDYVDLTDTKVTKGLLQLLSSLTGYRYDTIQAMVENSDPGTYLALGEIPTNKDPYRLNSLSKYGAAVISQYTSRLYYGGGIAPHVIGYVSSIQKEESNDYRRKGYRSDEKVGRKGLELWGDSTLAGKHGGTLYVFNPDGKLVSQMGSAPSQPGQDIYTTIDRDFQAGVQKAMSIFRGAVVVLERDTGRVLAMASSPGFNPNAFQTEDNNWNTLLTEIINNPDSPQFNRASQGQYPLGSVFKLITIAAALQSGRYNPNTTYECGYTFEELPGFTRYDWTWDHFQEDGVTQPSGLLTLPQGLIRSCNPFFWHMGLDLYNAGLTKAISDMARSYGLGSLTGIVGIDEEAGKIPDPQSQVDAINLAIGQGDTQVTPLQVASFVAALGNGGTLYRPQIIEKISPQGTNITSTFKAEIRGVLPISPENLRIIQEAMIGVVNSQRPRGTALPVFKDFTIPIAGKTGTAEASNGDSHAWFAGYTMANREGKPDIAIAVIAENAGEGSEIAAPIFRRVVELYFYGKPLKVYRWEATFDVTRSPTPLITFTPIPQPGLNP